MKNLVLGAAKGYGWDILEPFVTSCKMNCPDAQIVLIVGDNSDFTRDKLIRAGVRLENFPDVEGIPNNTRWKIILDFLERYGNDYETIFVTDTRDVLFQGNLFAAFDDCKNWLGFATEIDDIAGTLTGDKTNYNWLISCFGRAEADKLVDQKVICSGTIVGSSREMKIFCRELWKILEHKTADIFDQAVTNWLVYNGRVPVENIFDIGVDCGEIFTAYLYSFKETLEIRGGMLLRGNGGVPEVVHQYDRYDEVLLLVDELYRDKNFSFDPHFTDTRSLLEQVACLLCAEKISEATRLFLKVFFDVADLSKHASILTNILRIVAHKELSQAVNMLEVAVQNALTAVKNFSDQQLIAVHKTLIHAQKNQHAVDPAFKSCIANHILDVAEYNLERKDAANCFLCLNMINALDMVADEKFQRVFDEATRTFRRNS